MARFRKKGGREGGREEAWMGDQLFAGRIIVFVVRTKLALSVEFL